MGGALDAFSGIIETGGVSKMNVLFDAVKEVIRVFYHESLIHVEVSFRFEQK